MPRTRFDPDTLTLAAERDRLAAEYDRVETELADLEPDTARAASKQQYLADLDHMGREVQSLIGEYGPEAEVTVRGLDAKEYAKVQNRTAAATENVSGSAAPGSGRLVFAAGGLLDAPFYDGDESDLDAKLDCLGDQPIGVVKWVEDLVNERTVADEKNWRDSAERMPDAAPTT